MPETSRQLAQVALDARSVGNSSTLDEMLGLVDSLDPDGLLEIFSSSRAAGLELELRAAGRFAQSHPCDDHWVLRVAQKPIAELEDLTGLEPPLPLERALKACAALEPGGVYTARLPHRPRPLLRHLEARGLEWQVQERPDGSATLWVRRPVSGPKDGVR